MDLKKIMKQIIHTKKRITIIISLVLISYLQVKYQFKFLKNQIDQGKHKHPGYACNHLTCYIVFV
jgi:hypothetical protein